VARESRGQGRDRLACQHRQRRRLRERPAVGSIEARITAGRQLHRESLLVHRAMVAAAEQQRVGEAGGAAIGPGLDVVGVAQPPAAGREAAASVAMLESAAQGGRDGAGAAADVEHAAIRGMPHHHPRRVAGQPPGRFRGNAAAVREPGRTALAAGRQHPGVDVYHHLVAIAPSAWIEARGEGVLGHQAQGIGAALLRGSVL
jgi:hypothetical protein